MTATGIPQASQSSSMGLILQVETKTVALDCSRVQELVVSAETTAVPHVPDWILGVFNWRGKILPRVDLRLRLGLKSWRQECDDLAAMMTARAADHLEWMEELIRSVEERRPFTKTTDPHACAFGRWYDHFHTKNLIVSRLLRKMDAPHKAIHALAVKVEQAKAEGRFEAAARLIEESRETTLQRLLELMEKFESAVWDSYRPVTAVLEDGGTMLGLVTDGVAAVERIDWDKTEALDEKGIEIHSDLIPRLVRRADGSLAGLLEEGRLLQTA